MTKNFNIDPVGKIVLLNLTDNDHLNLAKNPSPEISMLDQCKKILTDNSIETNKDEMYAFYVVTTNNDDKDAVYCKLVGVQIELSVLSEETFMQMFGAATEEVLAFI